MASKRRDRRRSCEGKTRYVDETAAGAAAYAARKAGQHLGYYRCQHCPGWHLGHRPKWIRKSIASKARHARRTA